MAKIRLMIDMPQSSHELLSRYDNNALKYEQVQDMGVLLNALSLGMEEGRINIQIGEEDGVSSSGEFTVSGSGAQSVTINGEVLTGGSDYDIANLSASEIALNLAEAIRNSQSSRIQAVLAEADGAVVSLLAKETGEVGDLISIAASGAVSASAANLAGGSDPAQRILLFNRKA